MKFIKESIKFVKAVANDERIPSQDKKVLLALAWEKALECPFSEFRRYIQYISDKSRYGTHQAIKGLQLPRVMVILDDEDARGFLFSYEKLFGAKKLTTNDLNNIKNGKETGVDRTRRLFYVTCSRAE